MPARDGGENVEGGRGEEGDLGRQEFEGVVGKGL